LLTSAQIGLKLPHTALSRFIRRDNVAAEQRRDRADERLSIGVRDGKRTRFCRTFASKARRDAQKRRDLMRGAARTQIDTGDDVFFRRIALTQAPSVRSPFCIDVLSG
jgi:hypothetical protein